jgi:RNA polymerase sigma-70 factor (ECF subfamily)
MLRAWRAWETSGTPTSEAAWMTKIAQREAVRWRSGPNGRSWSSSTAELPEPTGQTPDVVLSLDVDRALDRLTTDDRALVTLRYRADLTQAEIARLTGIPEGTVKVRLHRARSKLRTHLT